MANQWIDVKPPRALRIDPSRPVVIDPLREPNTGKVEAVAGWFQILSASPGCVAQWWNASKTLQGQLDWEAGRLVLRVGGAVARSGWVGVGSWFYLIIGTPGVWVDGVRLGAAFAESGRQLDGGRLHLGGAPGSVGVSMIVGALDSPYYRDDDLSKLQDRCPFAHAPVYLGGGSIPEGDWQALPAWIVETTPGGSARVRKDLQAFSSWKADQYARYDLSAARPLPPGGFTIEAWVRMGVDQGSWTHLLIATDRWALIADARRSDTEPFRFVTVASGAVKPTDMLVFPKTEPSREWTHVAVSVSPIQVTGFLDGREVARAALAAAPPEGAQRWLSVGAGRSADAAKLWGSVSGSFGGTSVAALRLWDRPLSATELQRHRRHLVHDAGGLPLAREPGALILDCPMQMGDCLAFLPDPALSWAGEPSARLSPAELLPWFPAEANRGYAPVWAEAARAWLQAESPLAQAAAEHERLLGELRAATRATQAERARAEAARAELAAAEAWVDEQLRLATAQLDARWTARGAQIEADRGPQPALADFIRRVERQVSRAREHLEASQGGLQLGRVEVDYRLVPTADGRAVTFPDLVDEHGRARSPSVPPEALSVLSLEFDDVRAPASPTVPTVITPDLSGLTEVMARRTLERLGLSCQLHLEPTPREEDAGRVVRQVPAPGASWALDRPVLLCLGKLASASFAAGQR